MCLFVLVARLWGVTKSMQFATFMLCSRCLHGLSMIEMSEWRVFDEIR